MKEIRSLTALQLAEKIKQREISVAEGVLAALEQINSAESRINSYVTLDEGFLETGYNVTESIPVYSIVNSLVQNTDAQKVQISINGETNQLFRESISFDTIFERNEELVE